MRVLFNCSNIVIGGGIQVSAEMIEQFRNNLPLESTLLCASEAVIEALDSRGIAPGPHKVITRSPAQSISSRRHVAHIEKVFKADCVFTVFGPSYVRFKSPELMGVADGWVTHSTPTAFSTLSGSWAKFYKVLLCRYKALWYRRASHWIVEAGIAKDGLVERFGFDPEKITVASNCCASHYYSYSASPLQQRFLAKKIRILVFAAGYPHKNLQIVPEVASFLRKLRPEVDFEFVLTLPEGHSIWKSVQLKAKLLKVDQYIVNIGKVPVADGPRLYDDSAIVFMPSLLETFSAVYPEAMAMSRPIVTTDLDFAHSICNNAAIYFEPQNPASAASQILRIIDDSNLREDLVRAGHYRLQQFLTPRDRFRVVEGLLYQLSHRSAPNVLIDV